MRAVLAILLTAHVDTIHLHDRLALHLCWAALLVRIERSARAARSPGKLSRALHGSDAHKKRRSPPALARICQPQLPRAGQDKISKLVRWVGDPRRFPFAAGIRFRLGFLLLVAFLLLLLSLCFWLLRQGHLERGGAISRTVGVHPHHRVELQLLDDFEVLAALLQRFPALPGKLLTWNQPRTLLLSASHLRASPFSPLRTPSAATPAYF
eukprot:scaffold7052_cov254-Pinguiococcus_pyrenoidosus.AAC.77